MQWFLNLSLRAKLSIAMGCLVALLAVVILIAYTTITTIQQSQKRLFETEFANATDLLEDLRYQNAIRAAQLDLLILTNRAEQETWHQEIQRLSDLAQQAHVSLLKRNQDDSVFVGRINELVATRNDYKQTRESQIIPLIYEGKTKDLILGIQLERFRKMRSIVEELNKQALQQAQSAVQESAQSAHHSILIFVVVGIGTLLLSITMVILLDRIMAQPLNEISQAAAQMASGDMMIQLSTNHRADEVGILTQSFHRMTQYRQEMATSSRNHRQGRLEGKGKAAFGKRFAWKYLEYDD